MIAVLLALAARLPRPGRRRRPVVVVQPAAPVDVPPALEVGYGRRCAHLNPAGLTVADIVALHDPYAVTSVRHRPRTLVQFIGDDDFPTVPIRLDATDTAAWPRDLLNLLASAPAAAGVR